jgi:hypothetical protein
MDESYIELCRALGMVNEYEGRIASIATVEEAAGEIKRLQQRADSRWDEGYVSGTEAVREEYQTKLAKLREAVGAFNADIGKGCYGNNCLWPRNRGMATDYACKCLDTEHSTRDAIAALLEAAREVVKC